MKTHFGIGIIVLMLTGVEFLQGSPTTSQPELGQTVNVPQSTPYAITVQDANSRVWQRTTYERSASSGVVTNVHSYTELASGLNHLANGKWVESSERIDILPNGTAVATNGQQQAYFPGDIYQGQIELVTPDGHHLKSRPVCLSYFDGTNSVLIAELTNSIGQVLGTNQVIYTDAFTDFKADLRYTYKKAGFEQDIILREQPPTPESLGLNPDTARLQVLTEFFDPPQPTVSATTVSTDAGDLKNDNLDFGVMQMVPGRAFLLGNDANDVGSPVNKQWLQLDGRQILVEEVPVDAIIQGLAVLPLTARNGPNKPQHVASLHLILPPQRLVKSDSPRITRLAKAEVPARGFVLDYQTINSTLTSFTFRGDTTYYLSGSTMYLMGTTTFEGGAVIKHPDNQDAQLVATGPVICLTGPYRPVVFTTMDDNSVGDTISGSSGSPAIYHGSYSWLDLQGNSTLNYFRFCYANAGLTADYGSSDEELWNCQFVNCNTAIQVVDFYSGILGLHNVLFGNCSYAIGGPAYGDLEVTAEQVTANVGIFTAGSGNSLYLTNSIVIGGITIGGALFTNSVALNPVGTVFQTVGSGYYYLATNSPCRNAGTTNINTNMLADIATKTTYPPLLLTNQTVSTNLTLIPHAQRDTETPGPDLGYHYDPIDYIADLFTLTNATLTVTTGTAIASYNEVGFQLSGNSSIVSIGSPLNPNWIVRYTSVQEQSNLLGGTNLLNGLTVSANSLYGSIGPSGQYRFSKFACLAGCGAHFKDTALTAYNNLLVQECEFWSSASYFGTINSNTVTVFQNNLFCRSVMSDTSEGAPTSLVLSNNLFYGTTILLLNQVTPNLWQAYNNAFDSCFIDEFSTMFSPPEGHLTNGYNAYLNCTGFSGNLARFYPTNAFDIVSTNGLAYQTGPLGDFYQPSNSLLINKGSTTADQVGLYHYTVTTNEVVEGTNIVSIGYHYVATDASGNPLNTNGDGIPDYLEDANGDGIFDAGDFGDWKVSPFGLGGANQLQVFTPLK